MHQEVCMVQATCNKTCNPVAMNKPITDLKSLTYTQNSEYFRPCLRTTSRRNLLMLYYTPWD